MVERRRGPVRPPTLDLKARAAAAGVPSRADDAETARQEAEGAPAAEDMNTAPNTGDAATASEAAGPVEIAAEPALEPEPVAEPGPGTIIPPDPSPAEPATPVMPAPTEEEAPAAAQPSEPSYFDEPEPPRTPVPPPFPPPRRRAGWPAVFGGAVLGALLGAGLVYGFASLGYFPVRGPAFADPAPQLGELGQRVAALEANTRVAVQEAQGARAAIAETASGLEASRSAFEASLAELRRELAAVQQSVPSPADLSAVTGELTTLASRVDAIAAGASSADADALARQLQGLETQVGALTDEVATLTQGGTAATAEIAELREELATAQQAISEQAQAAAPPEPAPPTGLQMALANLESALGSGRPFAAELAAITTELPELAVPPALTERAGTGLMPSDQLAQQLEAAVPQMLASAPVATDAGWQQSAMDWARSLLAIRPAGEAEGDSIEAVISRLEAAVGRADYPTAATLLAALPEPMRAAAGPVAGEISVRADAAALIANLRARAPVQPDAPTLPATQGAAP